MVKKISVDSSSKPFVTQPNSTIAAFLPFICSNTSTHLTLKKMFVLNGNKLLPRKRIRVWNIPSLCSNILRKLHHKHIRNLHTKIGINSFPDAQSEKTKVVSPQIFFNAPNTTLVYKICEVLNLLPCA
jgi:hypothetical protein